MPWGLRFPGRGYGAVTPRERFLASLNYEPADFVFDMEFGYWEATWRRWHTEGLPAHLAGRAPVERFFGFEQVVGGGPGLGLSKPFQEEVIEEGADYVIVRDAGGVVKKDWKDHTSIPQFLDYPVKNRNDWEAFKERYDAADPRRYPADWPAKVKQYAERDYPLSVYCGGFYGWARDLMGVENLSIAFMLDEPLVRDMFEFRTRFVLRVIERAICEVQYDCSWWWEDMCYNHGPLVSPALFKSLMAPCYRRVVNELEAHGVHLHFVDCDGNIDLLAPLWLEVGVNVMFPVEAACSDPLELRRLHGARCLLSGGVNKHALINGPEAIDKELARLEPLVRQGGFIPHVDHRVPPDVSFENYKYYVQAKRRLIGRPPH